MYANPSNTPDTIRAIDATQPSPTEFAFELLARNVGEAAELVEKLESRIAAVLTPRGPNVPMPPAGGAPTNSKEPCPLAAQLDSVATRAGNVTDALKNILSRVQL